MKKKFNEIKYRMIKIVIKRLSGNIVLVLYTIEIDNIVPNRSSICQLKIKNGKLYSIKEKNKIKIVEKAQVLRLTKLYTLRRPNRAARGSKNTSRAIRPLWCFLSPTYQPTANLTVCLIRWAGTSYTIGR